MKNLTKKSLLISGLVIALFSVLIFNSCSAGDDEGGSAPSNIYGAGNGRFGLYTTKDLGAGKINVSIDGAYAFTISQYITNPTCSTSPNHVIKPAGTYSYSAVAENGTKWNGTFTVKDGQCGAIELICTGGCNGGGGSNQALATFFTLNSSLLSTRPITVTVSGITKQISNVSGSAPSSCTDISNANFDLGVGSHNYTATNGSVNWSGTIAVAQGGCSKVELSYSGGGGGGTTTGKKVFYTTNATAPIKVTVNGQNQYVTSQFSTAPNCGTAGAATFDLAPGNYSYIAENASCTWSGSFTITAGQCASATRFDTCGGGGGTAKQLTFWQSRDDGHGAITIRIDGSYFGTITGYYPSGTPSCGAAGTASGTISDGNHTWSAVAVDGTTWSGNFSVVPGCNLVKLL